MKKIFGSMLGMILVGLLAQSGHAYDHAFYGIGYLNQPRSVHAIDFDGDSDMDVVGCAYSGDDIYWYENNGAGVFTPHEVDTNFNAPYAIYAADINKDGQMDIAAASFLDDRVVWYANNGDGTFTSNTVTASGYDGPVDVVVVDLDEDNDLDFVTAATNADDITWWENDGSNFIFTENTIEGSFDGAFRLEVVDLDEDNDLDVVAVAPTAGDVAWFENDGSESFTTNTIEGAFNGVRDVQAVDIDGDNDLDVVATSQSNDEVTWWENDGSENFTTHVIDADCDGAYALEAADFDRDGDIDVVASATDDDRVYLYSNDGSENFTRSLMSRNYTEAVYDITAANLDTNNYLEIIVAEQQSNIIGYLPTISFRPAATQLELIKTTMYPNYCSMDLDGYVLFTGATTYAEIDIINVRDPENPFLVSEFNTSGGDEYNPARWIEVHNGYLYISNREEGLFQAISLNDLSNPTFADEIDLNDDSGDFVIRGSYAYVGDNDGDLVVVNIANPNSLSQMTSINVGGDVTGMASKGNYLYCVNRQDGEMVVVDVTNPSSPVVDNTFPLPSSKVFEIEIQGNYAYLAGHYVDLIVVDISDPQNPRQVGHFSSPGWSSHIEIADNYAFISYTLSWMDNQLVGVNMVDISDPTNPTLVQSYIWEEALGSSSNEGVKGLAVNGNYLYAGQWTKGLMIFKWKDDADPVLTPEPTVTEPFAGWIEKNLDEVIAYPNPTKGDVTFLIEDDNAEKVQIDIFNMNGERVASVTQSNPGQSIAWQIGDLSAGIYLYQTVVTVNGEQKKYKPKKIAISK